MSHRDIPTIQERRQQAHDQTVSDILLIARDMMQADGVAALSFNAIARRLGIKPPSLYTYFESKHAIYDTLFRMGFEAFAQEMDRVDRDAGLEGALRSALVIYMTFALDNPDLYQLMFQRPVPEFTPSDASMEVSLGALHRMRCELQDLVTRSGFETTNSIEQTTDLIIALMHGLTELQLANNPTSPVGEGRFGSLIDQAVQLLMHLWKHKAT